MSDINYSSAAKNKKFDNFSLTGNTISLTDAFGNSYLFVRSYSNSKRWHNIAKCEINTDGPIDENDGLVPDAVPFHAEEVAYLLAQAEEYQEHLEQLDSLLEESINLRRFRSKQKLKRLQRKEVSQ